MNETTDLSSQLLHLKDFVPQTTALEEKMGEAPVYLVKGSPEAQRAQNYAEQLMALQKQYDTLRTAATNVVGAYLWFAEPCSFWEDLVELHKILGHVDAIKPLCMGVRE